MQTMQGVVNQAHRVYRPGPWQSRQQPVAAVPWISRSSSCNNLQPLKHAACRKFLPICKSTGSSNAAKPKKNESSKKAPVSVNSSPASGSPVVAAATATVSTITDTPSTITMSNPPLGFSKPGTSLANNIVPAAPLSANPASRNPEDYSSDEELDDLSTAGNNASHLASRAAAFRCLILDSRYLPVNVVSWFRAVVMDESGKVDVLEYHPGGFAYSAYKAHPLPAVLRVRTFVDVHEFAGRLSLTRKNIMMRDHYRCQYCGSSQDLTLDHVTPVCRGGVNSWTNLVTACMACNQRKGDKTLAQMGWRLPRVPREPTPQELGVIAGINKGDLLNPPYPWMPYLATFKQMLEKAQRRAARDAQLANAAAITDAAAGNRPSSAAHASSADATRADSLSVTVHPAGPNSKAAKAAAAAAASVKSKAVKKHR